MTVTIELPPEIEAGLLAQAQAEGLDVADYVRNLVQKQFAAANGTAQSRRPNELTPEEWIIRFKEWSESPAHANLPVLSDYAMSRESIYEDRGL
jgi:hypothetical protein